MAAWVPLPALVASVNPASSLQPPGQGPGLAFPITDTKQEEALGGPCVTLSTSRKRTRDPAETRSVLSEAHVTGTRECVTLFYPLLHPFEKFHKHGKKNAKLTICQLGKLSLSGHRFPNLPRREIEARRCEDYMVRGMYHPENSSQPTGTRSRCWRLFFSPSPTPMLLGLHGAPAPCLGCSVLYSPSPRYLQHPLHLLAWANSSSVMLQLYVTSFRWPPFSASPGRKDL